MPDWASLRDAYGRADRVGELLDRAEADDRAVWDELWSRLCHQGTVYSASYAALPRLTEIAERRPPAVYVEPLHLATAIMSSTDGPEQPGTVRASYAEQASVLNRIAAKSLTVAADSADFVYALQALLATEVSAPWASGWMSWRTRSSTWSARSAARIWRWTWRGHRQR